MLVIGIFVTLTLLVICMVGSAGVLMLFGAGAGTRDLRAALYAAEARIFLLLRCTGDGGKPGYTGSSLARAPRALEFRKSACTAVSGNHKRSDTWMASVAFPIPVMKCTNSVRSISPESSLSILAQRTVSSSRLSSSKCSFPRACPNSYARSGR